MPKLYYPSPDEVQGAEPLNELVWFERYQHLLVKLANTDWGRDLLLIDKHPYPVVAMGKNYVRFHLGMWDNRDHWMSDYRVGAKWGNIIRYRWLEVKKAIDRMILLSVLESWHPIYDRKGKLLLPVGGGTTTTFFPDAHTESTTVDGMSSRHGQNETFSTIRGGDGTRSFDEDAAVNIEIASTSTTDQYSILIRFCSGFNTATIDDGDAINSATYSVAGNGASDGLSQSIATYLPDPASDTDITNDDYQDNFTATVEQSGTRIAQASWPTDDSYADWPLNATGLGNLSNTAVTNYGLKTSADIDNSAPSWISGTRAYATVICAETTGTSKDPKLVVVHSVAFTPRVLMF